MEKLVKGVHQFQSTAFRDRHELFERLTKGQNPETLFITCSDSRVTPDLITAAEPGDLFVLRNAGNLIPPHGAAQDSGEAATIEFAVSALHVRDVIVCGHTLCGAMHALIHPEDVDKLPRMKRWLGHADATRAIINANYGDYAPPSKWKATVEENVLVQLENLRTHPSVAAGLSKGTVKLHGWVFKIETGQVFAYDPVSEQFLPLTDVPSTQSANAHRARGVPPLASVEGVTAG